LWGIAVAFPLVAYPYNVVSPHWNHIRTTVTDYQTIYISDDAERARQYDWIASHYDLVIGDAELRNDTVYELKRRNAGLKWYAYTLNWTFMRINAGRYHRVVHPYAELVQQSSRVRS
jgi:hypothetical protein